MLKVEFEKSEPKTFKFTKYQCMKDAVMSYIREGYAVTVEPVGDFGTFGYGYFIVTVYEKGD